MEFQSLNEIISTGRQKEEGTQCYLCKRNKLRQGNAF